MSCVEENWERRLIPAALFLLTIVLMGCRQVMADQPKYTPMAPAGLFPDGTSAQLPPAGTTPFGGESTASAPIVTLALLRRGRERFEIDCVPCHDSLGTGHGMVVRRGFPPPPSFNQLRLRLAPASHLVDVMTHGFGVMYAYADRVAPADRWAIAAYIRALQLSQSASVQDLPPDVHARMEAQP